MTIQAAHRTQNASRTRPEVEAPEPEPTPTIEAAAVTTVEVERPRNPAAARSIRQAAFAEQDRRALHFLQQAGYEPGDDIRWERSGDTVTAEVRGDLDDDGAADDAAVYSSSLHAQDRPNGRRSFTLLEHGAATIDAKPNGELVAPPLGDGDGLTRSQREAYATHGRYTSVGGDARLEPGVRSDRVRAARAAAVDNLVALGVERDVATAFGGPDDDLFGPRTNDLMTVERQLRELSEKGVTLDGASIDAALSAEDFALESFDPQAHAAEATNATNAVRTALDRFDALARDGFVSRAQLASLAGGKAIAERFDALIFAHPTDRGGAAAWSGLSRRDLEAIQTKLDAGDDLDTIAADAVANSSVGRALAADGPYDLEAFSAAVEHRRDQVVVREALDGFEALANEDGFLGRSALDSIPGGDRIAERFDTLIFGNIEPGAAAWHGLSRADLESLLARLDRSEPLASIVDDLVARGIDA